MNQNLDPMVIVTMIVGSLLGPHLAAVVGPYMVILLAASAGAGWSLTKRPAESRWSALLFMLRINLVAFLLTWPAMLALEKFVTHEPMPWLAVPVAFGLGLVGDQWSEIFRSFLNWGRARLGMPPTGDGT
jgi:cytochrome c biogenesis protein CcdA